MQPQQPPHHPMPGAVPPHLSLANITIEQIQKVPSPASKESVISGCNCRCSTTNTCSFCSDASSSRYATGRPLHARMHQAPIFPPRPSMPFSPQQMQQQTLLPPQHQFHQIPQLPVQGHMDMRPGMDNGMHAMHAEATLGMNSGLPATSLSEFPKGVTAGCWRLIRWAWK